MKTLYLVKERDGKDFAGWFSDKEPPEDTEVIQRWDNIPDTLVNFLVKRGDYMCLYDEDKIALGLT